MSKLNPIFCKTCKEEFTPKSERNIFCSRKCFKKDFYHRKKAEELISIKTFPCFICPSCGNKVQLEFDPVKEGQNWLDFVCPGCNTLMINVSDQISTDDISI